LVRHLSAASLWPRNNPRFQLSPLLTLPIKQPFYHILVLESKILRYFTLRFPFRHHCFYFRK